MGVQGLWKLVAPCGKIVPLEGMSNKVLAVDVSIWLHQALTGVQGVDGASAALLVLFHRLCKLLFYKIRPVFVFDGGVPAIKRQTMASRRIKKTKARSEATRIRTKLLKNMLKHEALRRVLADDKICAPNLALSNLPGPCDEEDLYKLPECFSTQSQDSSNSESGSEDSGSLEADTLDLDSVDVTSNEFRSLPAEMRHDILSDLKDCRKQNSWRNINQMPDNSQEFSNFQMNRLLKRRAIQVSLEECGKEIVDKDVSLQELQSRLGCVASDNCRLITGRIAQDDSARFLLAVVNENSPKTQLDARETAGESDVNFKASSSRTEINLTASSDENGGFFPLPVNAVKSKCFKSMKTDQDLIDLLNSSGSESDVENSNHGPESPKLLETKQPSYVEPVLVEMTETEKLFETKKLRNVEPVFMEVTETPKHLETKKLSNVEPVLVEMSETPKHLETKKLSNVEPVLVEMSETEKLFATKKLSNVEPVLVEMTETEKHLETKKLSNVEPVLVEMSETEKLFETKKLSNVVPVLVEMTETPKHLETKKLSNVEPVLVEMTETPKHFKTKKLSNVEPVCVKLTETLKHFETKESSIVESVLVAMTETEKLFETKKLSNLEPVFMEMTETPKHFETKKLSNLKPVFMEMTETPKHFETIESSNVEPVCVEMTETPKHLETKKLSNVEPVLVEMTETPKHFKTKKLSNVEPVCVKLTETLKHFETKESSIVESVLVAMTETEKLFETKKLSNLEPVFMEMTETPKHFETKKLSNLKPVFMEMTETPKHFETIESSNVEPVCVEMTETPKHLETKKLSNVEPVLVEITETEKLFATKKLRNVEPVFMEMTETLKHIETKESSIVESVLVAMTETDKLFETKKLSNVEPVLVEMSETQQLFETKKLSNVEPVCLKLTETLKHFETIESSNVEPVCLKLTETPKHFETKESNNVEPVCVKLTETPKSNGEVNKETKQSADTCKTETAPASDYVNPLIMAEEEEDPSDTDTDADDFIPVDDDGQGFAAAAERMGDALTVERNVLLDDQARQQRLQQTITDQIHLDAQELLRLFGVPFVIAPMEAEAQCAALESLGLTNGTITDDSDIWLFGGHVVYRDFFNQQKRVQQFKSDDIERILKLTRDEMVRLAMLVGSDYTTGLTGVGPVTALEILAAFPPSSDALSGLRNFREWLASGFIKGPTRITLKNKLKNTQLIAGFPNDVIADAYFRPSVDESKEPFSWSKPDLALLEKYTRIKFGWTADRCQQQLMPVLKKLTETNEQHSILRYFDTAPATLSDGVLSKRVEGAVKRLGRPADEFPAETPSRCSQVKHADPLTERLHQKMTIPQRERDRIEKQELKKRAAKILKKSSKKLKTSSRPVQQINLSESSSDSD